MYEEHIGTMAHSTVGNLAGADIEKRNRLSTKEIGRFSRSERGHQTSKGSWGRAHRGSVTLIVVITTSAYSQ